MFSPFQFKKHELNLDLDDQRLSSEVLLEYGQKATMIRKFFLKRADEMSKVQQDS